MHHPRYRDHYTSAESETDAPIHGPYRLEAISSASFDETAAEPARQTINEWLNRYGPVTSDQIEGDLDSVIGLLVRATLRFRLQDLGPTNQHDFGWVLSDFCEFVAIDQDRLEVTLLVAAGD